MGEFVFNMEYGAIWHGQSGDCFFNTADMLNARVLKNCYYPLTDDDYRNPDKKKEKLNELNRLLMDELIEDIVVSEDGNIKVIFKYEDKYFEALGFINKQKYDIILFLWKGSDIYVKFTINDK